MDDNATDDSRVNAMERFKADAWPWLASLLRVARMLTRDEHQAEDLVQETMMRAYRHIASFEEGTNMKAWLMTILRRLHIDQHRRDTRQVTTGSLDAMAHEPAAHVNTNLDGAWAQPDELLNRIDDETIERGLCDLPEAMRWVLLLVDVEQMSVTDAAETLEVAPGTIKSRASRARARLREALLPVARQRGWVADPVGD